MSQITVKTTGIDTVKSMLAEIKGISAKVNYRAINKTIDKGRTLISKKVREQASLKAGYVRERLQLIRATTAKQSGAIVAQKRGILLSRFARSRLSVKAKSNPARLKGYPALSDDTVTIKALAPGRRQSGISVRIKPSGSNIRGKFFPIRLSNGVVGLAVRTGRGRNDYDVKYGPSVSQIFERIKPDVEPVLADEYVQQYGAQLSYELSKLK